MTLFAFRDFSLSLAHTYIAGLLLEQVDQIFLRKSFPYFKHSYSYVKAMATGAAEDRVAATEWCSRDLVPVVGR